MWKFGEFTNIGHDSGYFIPRTPEPMEEVEIPNILKNYDDALLDLRYHERELEKAKASGNEKEIREETWWVNYFSEIVGDIEEEAYDKGITL